MSETIETITIERRKTEELRYNEATGEIEVHVWTTTFENGKATGRTRHCEAVIAPGDDVSKRSAKVQTLARATWTPEQVKAWTAQFTAEQAAERAKREAASRQTREELDDLQRVSRELVKARADVAALRAQVEAERLEVESQRLQVEDDRRTLEAVKAEYAAAVFKHEAEKTTKKPGLLGLGVMGL